MVADLSFISLRTVLAALVGLAAPGADLVLLVKPQFEAGRAEASRGTGRDPRPRGVAARARTTWLTPSTARGAAIMGVMVSPLTGADGNVEFLLHAVAPHRPDSRAVDLAAVVAEARGEHR